MTTMLRTGFDALCHDLDDAVRSTATPAEAVGAVGSALAPYLGRPDLLTPDQRTSRPDTYTPHLLHVADDGAFSLVGLVWRPGQATPVHDHLSWCVVGIHEGVEYETRYVLSDDGAALYETGRALAHPGDVAGLLPPGDIHRVRNDGDTLAISLHVYGADLRRTASSVRRRYDLPVRTELRTAS